MGPFRRIARDDRGAMMVMGVFKSAILVGAMYALAGISDTVVLRERIQDATDTGAFAQTAMHARGMNFISLLNVVMAAFMSLLSAIQAIIDLTTLALTVAKACCATVVAGPVCCPVIGPLEVVKTTAQTTKRTIQGYVTQIVRFSDKANKAMAIAVPGAGTGKMLDTVQDAYGPQAGVAFSYPAFKELPVEVLPLRELCRTSGEDAVGVAMKPFDAIPLPGKVKDVIEGALEGYARASAMRLCGLIPNPSLPSISVPAFSHKIWTPSPSTGRVSLTQLASYVGNLFGGDEGRMKVPDDAKMGGEDFQLRVLVVGNREGNIDYHDEGVGVAALFDDSGDRGESYKRLTRLGRVVFAQSEFYFDGDEDAEEWLVKMKWQTRLRRFRRPRDAIDDGVTSACNQWGGGALCDGLDPVMDKLGDLVVH